MEIYSKTDVGKVRNSNQDAVEIGKISDDLVWSVVCDGMGGVAGGDVASKIAVSTISSFLSENLSNEQSSEEIKSIMCDSVNNANNAIRLEAKKDLNLQNMGTTVILCVVKNAVLYVVHVGDSRAYLVTEKEINQITTDHSMVQEMLNSGKITAKEAKNHPQKNIITRALGVAEEVEMDYEKLNINPNDIIVSCTDGLTNHVEESDILKICKENKLSELPKILINNANSNGGTDNITVSVIGC